MTITGTTSAVEMRALPAATDGALWVSRSECGLFEFRGSALRIEVPNSAEVLFPTDCGLSLLTAIDDAAETVVAGHRVLDVGSGSGLYSIAMLAAGAERVTAVDVNPASADVTLANAAANRLDVTRLSCVVADLAEYVPDDVYDLIVANPPHLPDSPAYATKDGLGLALIGGPEGRALYDVIVDRVDDLLAPNGTLLIAHSSLADVGRTRELMAARGYDCRIVAIFEMDIPLRVYAEHSKILLRKLETLRHRGRAAFKGNRFFVHVLAFRRTAESA
ncbi:MAG TPA: HemK2/MTQ2 family protein methyltransferase [Streptosporangiaceae bacterium]|nr:HemK2/MTQ2 family protein methyltransferase [Streptosporangiaceae bacterium]